jgi:hypothetical protein
MPSHYPVQVVTSPIAAADGSSSLDASVNDLSKNGSFTQLTIPHVSVRLEYATDLMEWHHSVSVVVSYEELSSENPMGGLSVSFSTDESLPCDESGKYVLVERGAAASGGSMDRQPSFQRQPSSSQASFVQPSGQEASPSFQRTLSFVARDAQITAPCATFEVRNKANGILTLQLEGRRKANSLSHATIGKVLIPLNSFAESAQVSKSFHVYNRKGVDTGLIGATVYLRTDNQLHSAVNVEEISREEYYYERLMNEAVSIPKLEGHLHRTAELGKEFRSATNAKELAKLVWPRNASIRRTILLHSIGFSSPSLAAAATSGADKKSPATTRAPDQQPDPELEPAVPQPPPSQPTVGRSEALLCKIGCAL